MTKTAGEQEEDAKAEKASKNAEKNRRRKERARKEKAEQEQAEQEQAERLREEAEKLIKTKRAERGGGGFLHFFVSAETESRNCV